ncbi:hypothetical protein HYH03_012729 [Edaphochlamys debaryana]|uniref:Uncharacterized protein n=1 Tax=Edaphochlamys debaryana TaxID=47281 RepID=A0A835XS85_9CHLO|nr:hypothetical protein HYH03_012729 [Edaphochlamys debaryana]|eukprot:KAG2488730.1 hypothetical protein HYH03_012729 [Edaphochlamys debaryana]
MLNPSGDLTSRHAGGHERLIGHIDAAAAAQTASRDALLPDPANASAPSRSPRPVPTGRAGGSEAGRGSVQLGGIAGPSRPSTEEANAKVRAAAEPATKSGPRAAPAPAAPNDSGARAGPGAGSGGPRGSDPSPRPPAVGSAERGPGHTGPEDATEGAGGLPRARPEPAAQAGRGRSGRTAAHAPTGPAAGAAAGGPSGRPAAQPPPPDLSWTPDQLAILYDVVNTNESADPPQAPSYPHIIERLGWASHPDRAKVAVKVRTKYCALKRLLRGGFSLESRAMPRVDYPYPLVRKVKEVLKSFPDCAATIREVLATVEADPEFGPILDRRPDLGDGRLAQRWEKQVGRVLAGSRDSGIVKTGQAREGLSVYRYEEARDTIVGRLTGRGTGWRPGMGMPAGYGAAVAAGLAERAPRARPPPRSANAPEALDGLPSGSGEDAPGPSQRVEPAPRKALVAAQESGPSPPRKRAAGRARAAALPGKRARGGGTASRAAATVARAAGKRVEAVRAAASGCAAAAAAALAALEAGGVEMSEEELVAAVAASLRAAKGKGIVKD